MTEKKDNNLPFVKGERIFLGVISLLCLVLISIGLILKLDPSGLGTHTQLGLPPCEFLLSTGKPCITCGATTAFVLCAHGRIFEGFKTHPFGAFVFFACIFIAFSCIKALVTGNSLLLKVAILPWGSIIIFIIAFALLSWIYKLLTWNPK